MGGLILVACYWKVYEKRLAISLAYRPSTVLWYVLSGVAVYIMRVSSVWSVGYIYTIVQII